MKSVIDTALYNGLPVPDSAQYRLGGTDAEAAEQLAGFKAVLAGKVRYQEFDYPTCFGIEIPTGGASLFYTKIRDAAGRQS